jgi:Tfp pilus assembly protein PilW
VTAGREHGFSLLELVVATALMLATTAAVFTMMHPAEGAFAAEPEVADMQQRLRVAADILLKDLNMAGGGAYQGLRAGPLVSYFPPVLPFRQGGTNEDPPGTFASDRITIIYVGSTAAQTTLTAPLIGPTPTFTPASGDGCALAAATGVSAALCGFANDQTVLVYDTTGNYGVFTIVAADGAVAKLAANAPAGHANSTFPAGSTIVEAASYGYYLRSDGATGAYQLMQYDGGSRDAAAVDNVVSLGFEYFGEAQPPTLRHAGPEEMATTYGPAPTAGGIASCLFTDAIPAAPVLPVLGDGSHALVPLTAQQLTDGPFCPSDAHESRWDADLLRIRRIAVTLRVQSAAAALRGPASALFARAGTSSGGARWVPDQEIHFDVSPRNLNFGR